MILSRSLIGAGKGLRNVVALIILINAVLVHTYLFNLTEEQWNKGAATNKLIIQKIIYNVGKEKNIKRWKIVICIQRAGKKKYSVR